MGCGGVVPTLVKEIDEKNKIIDDLAKMNYYIELSRAAFLGATLTITSTDGILISDFCIDKVKLEEVLAEYNGDSGTNLSVQDVVNNMEAGAYLSEDLKEYINWFQKVKLQQPTVA